MILTNREALMGGFGSGPGGTGKARCEGALFLDVRMLKKRGWLVPGSSAVVTWKMGATTSSVEIKASEGKVRVSWASGGVGYEESLPRCSSSQPLGGERSWWSCPGCSSRCAILYMRSMRWRCRACHDLVHASTRERCPIERVRRKHRLVALKLGLTGDAVHAPDMNAPLFPERPKGMHGATYTKLIQQHLSMRAEAIQAIIKELDR
jgi:hypothetical protein